MSESIQKRGSRWISQLSKSEQNLLLIGGVIVFMALFWVMIYQPVNKHINNQVEVKSRLSAQLISMKSMTGTTLNQNPTQSQVLPIPSNMTFSSWVDQQLRLVNLQEMVNRTEPIDTNSLSVWLQDAPFDQCIDWIQTMSNQYAVQVDQIDISVVDSTLGLVNIRMRLVK